MSNSILTDTKKLLGYAETDDSFDLDIMTHINAAFLDLSQLGVGPEEGFMIEDATTTWDALLGTSPNLQAVKSLIYLKVRLAFDPPATSFHITAMEKLIAKMEWRLNADYERTQPVPTTVTSGDEVSVWIINENEPLPEDMEAGDVGYDPDTGNLWRET